MPYLTTRIQEEMKTAFQQLASATGLSDSELLRQLIHDALEEPEEGNSAPIPPNPSQSELERITVRLPRFLMEGVQDRAKRRGMAPSRWISSLLRANLMKQPVLTDSELLKLEENIRELAALGRNLNQIAKALNTAFHETDRLKLEHLLRLREAIQTNRDTINELVRVSRGAWRTD
jgi:predicted DNA binding CopG/RHH family protein